MFGDLTETSNRSLSAALYSAKNRFFKQQAVNHDIELQNALDQDQESAVLVTQAFKSYGFVGVLQGLNMKVPKGAIYALLGASGCGKTTLLGCITGRKMLASGHVSVFAQKPASKGLTTRIGYMPQETGLHTDFTIAETLWFFGRLLEMNAGAIKERTAFLVDLLLLPGVDHVIRELSGGQQRRVSLAIALLHKPELLILDEPTVGMDPILREVIWTHFLDIAKTKNVTIIITTHYISETSQADLVGFMRGGYLVVEDNPKALLTQHKTNSLEEVFLKLSIEQNVNKQENVVPNSMESDYFSEFLSFPSLKLVRLNTMMWKHCLWLRKNYRVMITVMLLPVFIMTVFCWAIGHDPVNLKVAVVNGETQNERCNDTLFCDSNEISCSYLRYLEKLGLVLLPYQTEEDAVRSVQKGETYASIAIKQNYSKAMRERAHHWQSLKPKDLEESTIDVVRDVSNKHVALFIQVYLYQSFETFFYRYVEACGLNKREMSLPLQWNTVHRGRNPNFTDFSVPGVLLSIAFIIGVILTAWAVLLERNEASLERTLVVGINKIELLLSHAIVQFAVVVVQMILTMICTFAVFGMTAKGSLLLTAILLFLTGLSGICFGLLVSCIAHTQIGICLIAIGAYFTVTLTSGLIWPIEGMHPWLKFFAVFLPLTKPTQSLRDILHREWGFLDHDVYVGFVAVSAWSLVFLLISIMFIKLQKD